ncbi:MAG TPA: DUF4214 domain-containing protein [Noviherbaspirillum sp.]|jgi:hypothetical protein|uniref:DUF4214 domain-containing protein n=1 Tax=Noviherbaspirillum sp. TaxID=1926288 RepID=UPI002DDCD7BF|nr:DUF4214 domain-containing protein [Noviherbaspirillum sp.]HEV2612690.1 DUF4214 domain-containing protein [Noviherbaspirillum sp.]
MKPNFHSASLLTVFFLASCGGSSSSPTGAFTPSTGNKTLSHLNGVNDQYENVVQQLYIAYFGRPADPGGLANAKALLASAGGPTEIQNMEAAYVGNAAVRALIDGFSTSEESRRLYGSGDTTALVTAIYRNVLNRAPDPEGLRTWVTAIDSGALNPARASYAILVSALTNTAQQPAVEAALITNKTRVASSFTHEISNPAVYNGDAAVAIARNILTSVTSTTDVNAFRPTVLKAVNTLASQTSTPAVPAPAPVSEPMTMACVDGAAYQCSGDSIHRIDYGVGLMRSGVQVYGRSTSDLATPIADRTRATGLAPASGGVAEIRVAKDAGGRLSSAALILRNFGLFWDGRTERPLTIETFNPTRGRTVLGADGALAAVALPPSSDLSFFDGSVRGAAGTQANYANNRYFPRSEPLRCATAGCPAAETAGLQFIAGDWRPTGTSAGGTVPDNNYGSRLHGDGDMHAGDNVPGGTGPGVPFPGSKGYRVLSNRGLQYANMATWFSQDTVQIAEWTGGSGVEEHNKNRRGAIAFGAVSDPAAVPATGAARYSGFVHGWYAPNATDDPAPFQGNAVLTPNFATRQVTVEVHGVRNDDTGAALPISFNTTIAMGAAGTSMANYMTGTVTTGLLNGGLSARYFGPAVASGASAGPAEAAGALQLFDADTGATVVGGFIARKE